MSRARLLLLVPALLVGGVVAVTLTRLMKLPEPGPTGPQVGLETAAVGGVTFEVERRPGSERYQAAWGADGGGVLRGEDRFDYSHGIPLVNGTAFPSPRPGDTVRWNLDGPLLVNGRPVAPHRFQPRPLDAEPTELTWDIKNPSDAPRDSLSADWSKSGRVLVTAHGDGCVRVWDVEKRAVRTLVTPDAPTTGRKRWGFKAAISPDGRTIAAANVQAPAVTLWEADTGKLIATLAEPAGNVTDLRFASDLVLTEARDGFLHARDLTGDRSKVTKLGAADSGPMASIPTATGTRLAKVDNGGALTLGDSTNGVEVRRLWWRKRSDGSTPAVGALAFFADGKTLAVGAADGLHLYDVESGRERGWVQTLSIRSLAVSGDGALLAATAEHGPAVCLWRVADLQPK